MPPHASRSWAGSSRTAAMHREHALGIPSARSYLLTILGEFVYGHEAPVWTSTLIQSLSSVDIDEKTARQTVARTSARGLLTAEKIGRRTRWELTPRANRLLGEGTERIYTFHTNKPPWNKKWVLIVTAIPEARRDARYRLKIRLGWAGFAPASAGFWICPWTDREDEAKSVLAELGLESSARIFVGALASSEDPGALASEAWDLVSAEKHYQYFSDMFVDFQPQDDRESFRALTLMINEWRRLPLVDPDLPAELLPPDWSGYRAVQLFHALHGLWKPAALRWWQSITSQ